MNTNEETMAMMPQMPQMNETPTPPPTPRPTPRPARKKQDDHMGAKIAAGVVGGMAVAGAGAGVVYAMDHIGNDAEEVSHEAEPTQDVHVNHVHHVHQPAQVNINIQQEDVEPDVHFVGINVTDIDEDGNYEITGSMTVNGQEVLVVDVDMDGTFDVAVADFNNNAVLEENEIIDIANEGLKVQDFYAGVAAENPEAAESFMAQLNAVADSADPTLASLDGEMIDEDAITVGLADDANEDAMVNVIDSDENDIDDGSYVAVVQSDNDQIDVDSDVQVDVDSANDSDYASVETYEASEPEPSYEPEPEPSHHEEVQWAHNDVSNDVPSVDDPGLDAVDC